MGFGLLMRDTTPVAAPFRRSGRAAEESIKLGFVPAGPYFPSRAKAMGFVPGGPYFPAQRAMGFVPGGPYYPKRFRGYGIPPGQAARVPQYNGAGASWLPGVPETFGGMSARRFGAIEADGTPANVPGVPESFGEDIPTSGMYDQPLGPVYVPADAAKPNTGFTWDWQAAADATGKLATSIVKAATSSSGFQSCPPGYVNIGNGQCARTQQASGGMSTALLLGGLGLAAVLLLKR